MYARHDIGDKKAYLMPWQVSSIIYLLIKLYNKLNIALTEILL